MATASNEADTIRRQMAEIRQSLHRDMQGVVAGAEAASDWRHYVRLYPWAALGGASALGYFLMPRRRRSVSQTAEKAAEKVLAKAQGVAEAPKEEKKRGLIGGLFALSTPVLLRAAQSYAVSYFEQWLAAQQSQFGPGPSDHSSQPGAGPRPQSGGSPGVGPVSPSAFSPSGRPGAEPRRSAPL